MKRKIIALFVTFLLIFQTLSISVIAADTAEVVETAETVEDLSVYTKYEDFLKALSIVKGGSDFAKPVTRGEVAANIVKFLKETDFYQNYREIFSDVAVTNVNALAIEKLADLGIVRGDGNYRFRPDDQLTYNEASIIFMNVLGYGLIPAENTYLEAGRVGILDNVQAKNSVVNLGDFYIMMYNTLFANPIVQTSYGSEVEYQKSEQTMLYKLYDVVYEDGVIIKNDWTYLWSDKDAEESSIEIQTANKIIAVYLDDMSSIRDEIGKRVRVFFLKDDATGLFKYVHHMDKDSNRIIDIKLEQVEPSKTEFSKKQLAYYKIGDSKYTTLKLSDDYNIIYNNIAYKDTFVDFSALSNEKGTVRLIDSDSSGSYETVIVKVFDSFIPENISLNNGFISDKFDSTKTLNIDEDKYDRILVYNSEGNLATLGDIKAGCIISAAISDSDTGHGMLEIHISEDVRNGKLTKYKKGEFVKYITLDEETNLNLYDRAAADTYSINSSVTAYVDVFGDVVYLNDKTGDLQYGLLIGYDGGESSLKSEVKVRYITSSGELIETKLDEKPIIDGITYKDRNEDVVKALSLMKTDTGEISFSNDLMINENMIPIRYLANEDGTLKVIDSINTSSDSEKNDDLRLLGGGTHIILSGNVIAHKIPYKSDTTVLSIVSDDPYNLDTFAEPKAVTSTNMAAVLKKSRVQNMLMYNSDKDSPYADFVIQFASNFIYHDNELFVVDEIVEAYNEERDEVMTMICGYGSGAYKEYWVKDISTLNNIKKYKRGDILRIGVDLSNIIITYEEILKRTEAKSTFTLGYGMQAAKETATTNQVVAIICGHVKSRRGSLIETNNYATTGTIENIESVNWDEASKYFTNGIDAPVMVVDDTEDKVFIGTIEDIYDYDNFGNQSSFVLMRWRASVLKEIIVYNK